MSKWLNQFLGNEIVNRTDKSDRLDLGANLSGLSGCPQELLDDKKVENNLMKGGDKSDRFNFEANMSPLSLPARGLLDEKVKKVKNNPGKGGDKSDRLRFQANMSPLSLRTRGLFDEKLEKMEKMPGIGPDKPDKLDANLNMSGLSGRPLDVLERISSPYDEQDFEERLAIAEYDGGQTPLHAHRIAYLDAFISALTALPATDSQKDWLEKRIQTSLAWIEAQGYL